MNANPLPVMIGVSVSGMMPNCISKPGNVTKFFSRGLFTANISRSLLKTNLPWQRSKALRLWVTLCSYCAMVLILRLGRFNES